jgi:hypothetical protein
MRILNCILTVVFTLAIWSAGVIADPITLIGGTTNVTLTSAPTLTSLGLGVAPTGTATVTLGSGGIPIASFGITGNTPDNLIFHDGSGLRFSAGSNNLAISNFLINTTTGIITGSVSVNGTSVGNGISLFNIGSGLSLTLATPALNAFGSTFNLNAATVTALSTAVIGTASINPPAAAVPEPGSIALFLSGLPIIGAAARRRFQKSKETTN